MEGKDDGQGKGMGKGTDRESSLNISAEPEKADAKRPSLFGEKFYRAQFVALSRVYRIFPAMMLLLGLMLLTYATKRISKILALGSIVGAAVESFTTGLSVAFGVFWLAVAVVVFRAGGFLYYQVRHRYCMIASLLFSLAFPLGTLVGGWTAFLLSRPAGKALFEEEP